VLSGIWWIRVFGRGIALHAPWKRALFSERYGYRKMLRLGFGWRVEWLPFHHEMAAGAQRRIA